MTSTDEQPEPPEASPPAPGDIQPASEASQPSPDDSQPTPAVRPSPSGQRFWLRIALPLAVLIVAVVATVYVAAGGSSHPGTSGTSMAVPGTSASRAPGSPSASPGHGAAGSGSGQAGGAAAGGGQAGGVTGSAALTKLGSTALPLPKKLQAAVARWDAHGNKALAALSVQFGTVLQSAGVKQYVPMKVACGRLATEAAASRAGPPIPDAAMQELYAKALADFAQGADVCKAAVAEWRIGDETVDTRVNHAQLHRSLSLIAAGATDLYRATAEIVALRHH